MPSTMMHLFAAYEYNENGSPLYFIGSVSPDALEEWHAKDKTHFRDREDREKALLELAEVTDKKDDFAMGTLLHLFLDWRWDEEFMFPYKQKIGDESWFRAYRTEISVGGSWLHYKLPYSELIWRKMLDFEVSCYGETQGVSKQEVNHYLIRTYTWLQSAGRKEPEIFTPDDIFSFIYRSVDRFRKFLI